MQATRFSELTPRSVWDIVDDAFDLYRERFVLFLSCAAVIYIPIYVLRLFYMAGVYGWYYRRAAANSSDPDAIMSASSGLLSASLVLTPFWLFAGVFFTACAAAIVRDHLGPRQLTTVRQVFRQVGSRLGVLALGGISVALSAAVGFIACIFPALYVVTVLAFVPPILMLEAKGVGAAFKRSQDMIRPEFGRVLGALILLGFIAGILDSGIAGVIEGVFALLPHTDDFGAQQTQQRMVIEAVSGIVSLFLAPLSGIALTLLYYDFRVRREGLDIEARAQEVDYPLAPDPFGDMPSDEARRRLQRIQANRR